MPHHCAPLILWSVSRLRPDRSQQQTSRMGSLISVSFSSAWAVDRGRLADFDDARLNAGRWNFYRVLSELPDGNDHAEEECAVSYRFKSVAASFFGANKESISRFLVVVHKSCLVYARPLTQRSCQPISTSYKLLTHSML